MATSYTVIIERFLSTVSEYMFLDMLKEDRYAILVPYLIGASTQFNSACVFDLEDRDEDLQQFNADLTDEEIDILVDLMRVEWMKHKLYNSEKLRNGMSTKDYTVFSPANLLNEIRTTYQDARESATNRLYGYTYTHNRDKIVRLGNNGD